MGCVRSLIESAGGVGIRVARSLYARWRVLAPDQRALLESHAERLKGSALDLRGSGDRPEAERDLSAASEAMAAALVESAESDPEITEIEVRHLRDDLRRELDRLAGAGARASPRGGAP